MFFSETFPEGDFARLVAEARKRYEVWQPHTIQSPEDFAAMVLLVLDLEGRVLPPGGIRWVQWAVKAPIFDDGWFIDPSEERCRAQAILTNGQLLHRDVIEWQTEDRMRTWSKFVGPWREAS